MNERGPRLIAVAGSNGAGKSTTSSLLIREWMRGDRYLNADLIAQGISVGDTGSADIQAGRILLERMDALASERVDFAFETTLSTRGFAPRIRRMQEAGYEFRLVYVFLESSDLAVRRVRERVRAGGHAIPEPVIRRRYERGLANFFNLYRPLASTWTMYDNSREQGPRRVASGSGSGEPEIVLPEIWNPVRNRFETRKPIMEPVPTYPTSSEFERLDAAMRLAVRQAIEFHRRMGNPICVERDGKIVWIPPEEIPPADVPPHPGYASFRPPIEKRTPA